MTTAFKSKGPLPRLQTSWDLRAACNFIGGGTGTGLLITAALLSPFGFAYSGIIALGLIFIAFGLFMVWMEIGRPWRSMNLFFNPHTSWMTREGMLAIPIFALGALVLFFLPQASGTPVTWVIGILAAGYLYCQARMLHGAKGIPSWAHPALISYIMATGVTEGMGLATCFPAVATRSVQAAFALLLILRLVAWLRYFAGLRQGNAPQDSIAAIQTIRWIFVLGGHGLPIVLLAAAALNPASSAVLLPVAGLAGAMAGWLSKAVIITRAAHTHGFAIPRIPVRGQGAAGQAGKPGW